MTDKGKNHVAFHDALSAPIGADLIRSGFDQVTLPWRMAWLSGLVRDYGWKGLARAFQGIAAVLYMAPPRQEGETQSAWKKRRKARLHAADMLLIDAIDAWSKIYG